MTRLNYFASDCYDNLNRIVKSDRYDTYGPSRQTSSSSNSSGSTAGNLIMRSTAQFDDQSRIYQSIKYGVDPATGIVGNSLTDNFWFDASGNQIKSWPAGSQLFTKSTFDSLGRMTVQYSGYGIDSNYAAVVTVSNNTIVDQNESIYDNASNLIQSNSRKRYHNIPTTQLGPLQNPSMTPKARVTYLANYPDPIGRTVNSANYGTNGGLSLTRSSTAPSSTFLILVSSTIFDAAGNVSQSIDPMGTITQNHFDAIGRQLTVFQNLVTTSSSSSSSSSSCSSSICRCASSDDSNVTVQYTYTPDGRRATVTALNASTGNQTTTWTYGTTLSNSGIASSQLLLSLTFPDSTGGSDVISYSYNRQGENTTMTDQRGCVHSYLFDQLGRQIHDCVTTLGTGVDSAVQRLSTTYEVRGMINGQTSYDNPSVGSGSVVNDVQLVYNSFSQLVIDYQSHSGAVDTSTSPNVQYTFAHGSANTIRPTTLIYPNGRVLNYDYGTSGALNDSLSRIASLIDDNGLTHLADYSYLGIGTSVIVSYAQPSVEYILASLTGTNDPVTGDIYAGFDSFTRVKDCRWYNSEMSTDVARLKYGYDQVSNRLWRQDTVAASLGQAFDEYYSYDGLYRLSNMQRGTLSSSFTGINSPNFAQCWSLDATNNWSGFKESDDGSTWTLVQSRNSNKVNEITSISNSNEPSWVNLAYDPAGNATTMPQPENPVDGYTATYDAWNRLMTLTDATTEKTVQHNQFDARHFRTRRLSYTAGELSESRDFYYSSDCQSLEEWVDTLSAPERQQVWGGRYVDDLVLRDRDTTDGGSLNERLYGLQDVNWSIVCLVDTAATAQERYIYSPFGTPTYTDGTMSTVLSTSAIESVFLFTAQMLDPASQLWLFRRRHYDSITGRFISRDPLGFPNGPNTYAAWFIPGLTDPWGLDCGVLIGIGIIIIIAGSGCGCSTTPNCPPNKRRTPQQCCDAAIAKKLDHGDTGGVVCCDGAKIPCVFIPGGAKTPPRTNKKAIAIINSCIIEHEQSHIDTPGDVPCPAKQPCGFIERSDKSKKLDPDLECHAYATDIACMRNALSQCGADTECDKEVLDRMKAVIDRGHEKYKCKEF